MNKSLRTNEDETIEGLRLAVEEMKATLDRQFEGIQSIKNTSRIVFGTSSLIISLMSTFQIVYPIIPSEYTSFFNLGVVTSLIGYVVMITCCLYVLLPKRIFEPIKPNWETLIALFVDQSEQDIYRNKLSAYLNAIELNEPIIARHRILTMISSAILVLIVIVLLSLTLIPRVSI